MLVDLSVLPALLEIAELDSVIGRNVVVFSLMHDCDRNLSLVLEITDEENYGKAAEQAFLLIVIWHMLHVCHVTVIWMLGWSMKIAAAHILFIYAVLNKENLPFPQD